MSRLELYFHIVWATQHRQPFLTPQKEEMVFRCIFNLVAPTHYKMLAINGMPDHIHMLIQTGPQIDLPALMKNVKGTTSALVNNMTELTERFRWQEGYYAATITPSHLPETLEYVRNQKRHHREGTTRLVFENAGEA